jgi:gamma-glutamylaminecyclotransferase
MQAEGMEKKPDDTFLVFVYGTLKAGESNHSYHLSGAQFVGKGTTLEQYAMHDNGGYPVVFKLGDKPVTGEVYEVSKSQLDKLDYLEGHPRFFKREQINVKVDEPIALGEKECWMYFGVPKAWQRSVDAGLPRAKTDGSGAYAWSRA